ncbi:cation:dicarboxylate symporter family transporter [Pseudofrancisella aestuarii]|uniref:Cation:dicarboxylate symporter family transporter n=1 Tax=Pseudofrancisella aestuarii TaxID=2670347 RepID=A0ABV9T9V8_9GAMM|nr:dicarboxylate/amino acid:cation symporter [Pseudofrancisella aestuarii]
MLIALLIILALFVYLHIKAYSFNFRTILALVVGITIGLIYNLLNCDNDHFSQLVSIIGDGYISLLKMLIIPLVLTSIVHSIINLKNYTGSYIIKVAYKTIGILLIMTGVSAIIGALVALSMHTGLGINLNNATPDSNPETSTFAQTILGFFPSNISSDMTNNNVMAVVIFSILLGFAILRAYRENHELAQPFITFIDSLFFVVKKLANIIIALTPYGVLALMIKMGIGQNKECIMTVIYFIFTIYVALIIVFAMHIILLLIFRTNLKTFYKSVWNALLVAATTRSSMGTLPLSIEGLRKFGVSETVSTFAPTIGTTLGMNGCAGVFPAALAIMAMQISGVDITISTILIIGFICMLASLGVSGIPGTAFVAAGVVFSYFGLPWELIAIIIGVDAIVDTFRTPINIHGVMTTAVIVDKTTKPN